MAQSVHQDGAGRIRPGTVNSTTDANKLRAWAKAGLRFAVPTVCFGFVGIAMFLASHSGAYYLEPLLIPVSGLAKTLSCVYHHWPGVSSSRTVEVFLWAIGMQVFWLPYWMLVWQRPLSKVIRVVLFLGACLAVVLVNIVAFVFVGGPSATL